MRAALDDPTVVDHQDLIRVADGAQAVRDHEARPALHEAKHGLLDVQLRARVHAAGGLVQDEDGGIRQDGAGDGQELPLALAQASAFLGEHRVVAVVEPEDEGLRVRGARRRHDLGVRGGEPAVADVLPDRLGEEVGILQHDAERGAQSVAGKEADVLAVEGDGAGVDVVEPGEEVDDGGLPRLP